MFSEYPKEFVDSVMKPSIRNGPPSDTVYQGTVIIIYVKGISEKFRRIGNRFNLRTIFKTKHTLRGTLMKTGPVRDTQQTKQCVYSIPCDCGRCYISETSRPLEVHIKEHKYNLTQGLLEKSKLAQHAYEEGNKISCRLSTTPHTENTKNQPTCFCWTIRSVNPVLDISPIWALVITAEVKKIQLRPVQIEWEILCIGTIRSIVLLQR
jgi:hypothetical protein